MLRPILCICKFDTKFNFDGETDIDVKCEQSLAVMEATAVTAGLAGWLFFHRVKYDNNVFGISVSKSTDHSS